VPDADTKHPRIADLVGRELGAWLEALDLGDNAGLHASSCEVDDPALGGRFSVRATPLQGPDQRVRGLVVVARDRTQEVRLEADRVVLGERLAQAEKLAALGQFVAGIAHELNNPLQGVLGHLELLRATASVPRAMQPELRVVRREAERAAKIVNNLLVFAGSRRGTHRCVSLNTIVGRTAALRSRTARQHGIEIVRDLDRNLPRVRGDATLLQQALLNVIANAEHAIVATGAAQGRIRIATRTESDGATAIVEIADSGGGIPPESLPRIFEPFFTTKEVGKGTGLGLAIVYGIVHDHGGEISARNRIDGGAVFRIALPAVTMKPARARRE
jgi:two-component system NtrC family sensor kinase